MTDQENLKATAEKAALRGLDFLVRTQTTDILSADHGRFPTIYNCQTNQTVQLTTNWTSGVAVCSLLCGYKRSGNEEYLNAAEKACSYIKSLQDFDPATPHLNGVFHEETPQTTWAHPRDALTAGWGLLDYAAATGDEACRKRAIRYGDWFIDVCLEKDYPLWTVRFDDLEWEPHWLGSFHSGSAFFFYRLFSETGEQKYADAMRKILDFYNQYHMDSEGNITVILDSETRKGLTEPGDQRFTNEGWETMHRYNDDFGALANLAAWKVTGEDIYRDKAVKFFDRMCEAQHESGGFGPETWCVPSAAGAIVIEMLAAKQLGLNDPKYDAAVEKAIGYLLNLQNNVPGDTADGAFFGVAEDYSVSDILANTRTGGYAIMALLHYAGASDNIYFFE